MPISEEQRAANRANAARSTGPRTPQGKARSAQNARKHGFTASSFAVVRLEDLNEVAHLRDDLVAVYQPVNSQELFALERMAIAQQTLLRAARLEAGLFTTCLNEALSPDDRPLKLLDKALIADEEGNLTRAQNRNYLLAEGFHRMARDTNSWALFMRYHAQSERHYRRALEEFERVKALRPELQPELPNEPISEGQLEQNAEITISKTNPFSAPEPPPDPTPKPPLPTPVSKPNSQPEAHGAPGTVPDQSPVSSEPLGPAEASAPIPCNRPGAFSLFTSPPQCRARLIPRRPSITVRIRTDEAHSGAAGRRCRYARFSPTQTNERAICARPTEIRGVRLVRR
jgi:hypothetical protein